VSARVKTALLVTFFLVFQPYCIGISIFVYTDMMALFFLASSLMAFQKEKPVFLAISIAGALLCRQYFLFLPAAFILYYLIRLSLSKCKKSYKMLISAIASCIPLIFLFAFWGGFTPQNEMRGLYLQEGLYFQVDFLVLHISLFSVYLFPVILYCWKKYYIKAKLLLVSFLTSWIYFLFPVKAAEPAMAVNVFTVGFFHRFLRLTLGSNAEHFIFYILFLFSLPVVIWVIQDTYHQIKSRVPTAFLFTNFSILFFLMIMPFSYLNWEKYFLPLIPIALIQILGADIFKFLGVSKTAAND
jgi:hypothetical protein